MRSSAIGRSFEPDAWDTRRDLPELWRRGLLFRPRVPGHAGPRNLSDPVVTRCDCRDGGAGRRVAVIGSLLFVRGRGEVPGHRDARQKAEAGDDYGWIVQAMADCEEEAKRTTTSCHFLDCAGDAERDHVVAGWAPGRIGTMGNSIELLTSSDAAYRAAEPCVDRDLPQPVDIYRIGSGNQHRVYQMEGGSRGDGAECSAPPVGNRTRFRNSRWPRARRSSGGSTVNLDQWHVLLDLIRSSGPPPAADDRSTRFRICGPLVMPTRIAVPAPRPLYRRRDVFAVAVEHQGRTALALSPISSSVAWLQRGCGTCGLTLAQKPYSDACSASQ